MNLHRVGIGVTAPARRKKTHLGARSARACPSHAFSLKRDGQDLQDGQDEGARGGLSAAQ